MNKEAKSETRFAVTTQLLQMRHSRHSSPEIVHVTRANKKEAYPIRPVTAIVCTTKIATNSPTSPQAPASRVCHKYHRQLDLYSIAYTLRRKFNSRRGTLPIALRVHRYTSLNDLRGFDAKIHEYAEVMTHYTVQSGEERIAARIYGLYHPWRATENKRDTKHGISINIALLIIEARWKLPARNPRAVQMEPWL